MSSARVGRNPVRCVWNAGAMLGESPLWIAAERALYWLDILGGKLFRYLPAEDRREVCALPAPMSSLAPAANGGLICTGEREVCQFDLDTGEILGLHALQTQVLQTRINDGCCHPDGSFWFGTMDLAECAATGAFFRLSANGECTQQPGSCVITNGPAFSANGERAYFVDTLGRRILCADLVDGAVSGSLREFARIAASDGYPDGLAIDAAGGVWCAHWGGWRVTRFDDRGRVSHVIALPVANVTKCAFSGSDLRCLSITTARKGLSAAALAGQPLAGGLFEVEVDHQGFLPPAYGGSGAPGSLLGRACFFESA